MCAKIIHELLWHYFGVEGGPLKRNRAAPQMQHKIVQKKPDAAASLSDAQVGMGLQCMSMNPIKRTININTSHRHEVLFNQ